jgi:hypothetical protein
MADTYEAKVLSAHLPSRTVTFVFPEAGIPFCAGMFRIEYVRQTTDADEIAFPSPDDAICALCGAEEMP